LPIYEYRQRLRSSDASIDADGYCASVGGDVSVVHDVDGLRLAVEHCQHLSDLAAFFNWKVFDGPISGRGKLVEQSLNAGIKWHGSSEPARSSFSSHVCLERLFRFGSDGKGSLKSGSCHNKLGVRQWGGAAL